MVIFRRKVVKKFGLFFIIFFLWGCSAIAVSKTPDGVKPSFIVKQAQEVLEEANSQLESEGLFLSKVVLSLGTVMDSKTEGGIKILFFEAGGSKAESITNRVTVELSPYSDPTKSHDVGEGRTKEHTKKLVDSILTIAKSMSSLDQEKQPLEVKKITGEIKFVVKKSANGGVSGVEFLPISIDLGGTVASSYEQKLSIVVIKQ